MPQWVFLKLAEMICVIGMLKITGLNLFRKGQVDDRGAALSKMV